MVSAGVPPPVVKSVADAVAVQEALSRARSSVTVVVPISPVMVVPGAPEPRFAVAGAVIVSAPLVTAKVTVVSGSPGRLQVLSYIGSLGFHTGSQDAITG